MKPLSVRLACLLLFLSPLVRGEAGPAVSVPRLTHPGAGQTLYFVLTDRFANGSAANDNGGLTGGPDVTGFDPTRISVVPAARCASRTAGAELAIPGMLWCSATQKRR